MVAKEEVTELCSGWPGKKANTHVVNFPWATWGGIMAALGAEGGSWLTASKKKKKKKMRTSIL